MPNREGNPPPIVFILGPQPKPEELHHYNAFGIHKGFGKAYAEYYRRKDEEVARKERDDDPKPDGGPTMKDCLTLLLGAEGCSEMQNEPWLRDATAEEQERFIAEKLARHFKPGDSFNDFLCDGIGGPYWLKTVTEEAPEKFKALAARCVRVVRIE